MSQSCCAIHRPTGLSLKKHRMCGCRTPKQCSIGKVCNLELHATILWHVICTKLNTGKKITGLEIMTFVVCMKLLMKFLCNLFFTDIDFCKPGVIQGLDLNFILYLLILLRGA